LKLNWYQTVFTVYYSVYYILQCLLYTTVFTIYCSVYYILQCLLYTTVFTVCYSVYCMLQCLLYATVFTVYYSVYCICILQCLLYATRSQCLLLLMSRGLPSNHQLFIERLIWPQSASLLLLNLRGMWLRPALLNLRPALSETSSI